MAQRLLRATLPPNPSKSGIFSISNIRASPTTRSSFASFSRRVTSSYWTPLTRKEFKVEECILSKGSPKDLVDSNTSALCFQESFGKGKPEVWYNNVANGTQHEQFPLPQPALFCKSPVINNNPNHLQQPHTSSIKSFFAITIENNDTQGSIFGGGDEKAMSHLSSGTFNAAGSFDEHRRRNSVGSAALSSVAGLRARVSSVAPTTGTSNADGAGQSVRGTFTASFYKSMGGVQPFGTGRRERSQTFAASSSCTSAPPHNFQVTTRATGFRHYSTNGRLADSGYGDSQGGQAGQVPGTSASYSGHGYAPNVAAQAVGPAAQGTGSTQTTSSPSTSGSLNMTRMASTAAMGYSGQSVQIQPHNSKLPGSQVTNLQNFPLSTQVGHPSFLAASVAAATALVENTPPVRRIHEVDHYMTVPITDLVRAYTILNACTILGIFPSALEKMTHLFQRFTPGFVQDIVYGTTVKPTFYGHFCGGSSVKEVFDTTRSRLAKSGMGIILEYSVECDIGGETKMADKIADNVRDEIMRGVLACREDLKTRKRSPTSVAKMRKSTEPGMDEAMVAIKISALSPPSLLYRVTELINALKASFCSIAKDLKGSATIQDLRTKTTWFPWFENECRCLAKQGLTSVSATARLMAVETTPMYMLSMFNDPQRRIEWLDVERILTSYLVHIPPEHEAANTPSPFSKITPEDKIAWQKLQARLSKICVEASEEVPLLVDAEQTYFNPAIALATTQLAYAYNRRYPTLWWTQQLYLKSGVSDIEQYVSKAKREGWIPAFKLVRGAYMVSERLRARELRIPDPIHDTIEDTHHAYKTAIQYLLVNQSVDPFVVVASHNEDSIKYASGLLRHGVSMSNRVAFAQLKGMCDSMGVDLARQGFTTLKWVPYGPVRDAVPYLVRRVQENATLLNAPAARTDLAQMKAALSKRLGLSKLPPPPPQRPVMH